MQYLFRNFDGALFSMRDMLFTAPSAGDRRQQGGDTGHLQCDNSASRPAGIVDRVVVPIRGEGSFGGKTMALPCAKLDRHDHDHQQGMMMTSITQPPGLQAQGGIAWTKFIALSCHLGAVDAGDAVVEERSRPRQKTSRTMDVAAASCGLREATGSGRGSPADDGRRAATTGKPAAVMESRRQSVKTSIEPATQAGEAGAARRYHEALWRWRQALKSCGRPL